MDPSFARPAINQPYEFYSVETGTYEEAGPMVE